jgi:hypothetical protein
MKRRVDNDGVPPAFHDAARRARRSRMHAREGFAITSPRRFQSGAHGHRARVDEKLIARRIRSRANA